VVWGQVSFEALDVLHPTIEATADAARRTQSVKKEARMV
jgi:hypothetical protein